MISPIKSIMSTDIFMFVTLNNPIEIAPDPKDFLLLGLLISTCKRQNCAEALDFPFDTEHCDDIGT